MLQMHYAKHHILNVINDPENHPGHSKLYAAALVLALTYGAYDVHSYKDPRVEAVSACLQDTSLLMTPGLWKVDRYPWLRYVPGYLKPLQDHHQRELNLFRSQFNITKDKLVRR
jgi:LmbE family N-acetylglucosaminyl deacetylase